MITTSWYPPLVKGLTAPVPALDRPSAYSHVIKALGGFWSATMTQSVSPATMDDWILNGIGRHIRVHDETLGLCWEGFANQVDAVYGALTFTRGPLMGTANRVKGTFSTVDVTVIPPTEGIEDETVWVDHVGSQIEHGIFPVVISVSETNPADALNVTNSFLAQHAWPIGNQLWATGAAQAPALTIQCLGYVHWLFYVYNQLATAGFINTDAKIVDILTGVDAVTGNPYNLNSAWLPFGTTHVETPAAPAAPPYYEYEDHTAWELIQGIVARGDTNQNRWLFGIYEDREAYYQQAPTTVEYKTKLSDPAQRVFGPTEVKPWQVRPGKWLRFSDFLANAPNVASLELDPRVMFIEDVTYTMPNQLTLSGDPQASLSDIMASFGLGGVGV